MGKNKVARVSRRLGCSGRIKLGRAGEDAACALLLSKGFEILGRNVRNRLGELDIIARDGQVLVFVEVKTRSSIEGAIEAVDSVKQHKLMRLASAVLASLPGPVPEARFDVVAVDKRTLRAVHVKGAFEASGAY